MDMTHEKPISFMPSITMNRWNPAIICVMSHSTGTGACTASPRNHYRGGIDLDSLQAILLIAYRFIYIQRREARLLVCLRPRTSVKQGIELWNVVDSSTVPLVATKKA